MEVSAVPCVVSACINHHISPVVWQEAHGFPPLVDRDVELSDLPVLAPKEALALIRP